MRLPLLMCCLATFPASGAFAAPPSLLSAGLKLGVGGGGLPGMGLGFGPNLVDFGAGAIVQRAFGRRDAMIAGFEHQGLSNVQYEDEQRLRTVRLSTAFVGYKSRLTAGQSGPYVG